jgi:hypothetical protein
VNAANRILKSEEVFETKGSFGREPLPAAVFEVPPGTSELEKFLLDWAKEEANSLDMGIKQRASSLKKSGKFYHAGPVGKKIGDVVKPTHDVKSGNLFMSGTENLENLFEEGRKRTGGKIHRLKAAYAFEDPEDAIAFSYGGPRVVYVVVPLGPIERHDMNCVDDVEQLIAQYKDVDSEEDEKEIDDQIDSVIDAYWQGKPSTYESPSPRSPVWEILCSPGFEIVDVEDSQTLEESLLRKYIRESLSYGEVY